MTKYGLYATKPRAFMRLLHYLLISSLACTLGGVAPTISVRAPSHKVEHEELADLVVELTADDIEIRDVSDDEEETHDKATEVLCLAPPCGINVPASSLMNLPVPWLMRLTPPSVWA
mgnify:CR=1 FL=1